VTVAIVTVSHATPLEPILQQISEQTHRDVLPLVHACCTPLDQLTDVTVTAEPHAGDWGHEARAHGLTQAAELECEWVTFWNADDHYEPTFIAALIDAAEHTGADLAACDFTSHLFRGRRVRTAPLVGSITSGNFIARTQLAARVGWNHRHYEADGQFIRDLITAGATFTRVPDVLYHHQ
jgi:hypothetical protein